MRPRLLWLALLVFVAGLAWLLGLAGTDAADRASARPAAEGDVAPASTSVAEVDAPPDPTPVEPADPAPPQPVPPGTAMGVVRLPGGKLPADVAVVVVREGAPTERREIRPDADGKVWLDRLAPGRYRLRATHPDFAPRAFAFDVSEEAGAGPFEIVLTEGGTVRVRVADAGGVALEGRRVEVRPWHSNEPDKVGSTDASGSALFERLPAGYYWVQCGEGGFGPCRDVEVEPGRAADVVFDLSCRLFGSVFDASGQPLVKVGVRLQPVARGPEGTFLFITETDDAGRFELLGVRPGEYRPRVSVFGPGGYFVTLERVELAKGERRRHDLHIPPGRLSGRVRRDTGEPFGDVRVSIRAFPVEVVDGEVKNRLGYYAGWLTADGWSAEYLARADAEGRFDFVGLPPGSYELWVIAAERPLAVERRLVQVSLAEAPSVDFALPHRPAGKLRVRVYEKDGAPATGVLFSEAVSDQVSMLVEGRQVGDGIFELDLHVGPHKMSVYRVDAWTERFDVDVKENETVEKLVKAGSR